MNEKKFIFLTCDLISEELISEMFQVDLLVLRVKVLVRSSSSVTVASSTVWTVTLSIISKFTIDSCFNISSSPVLLLLFDWFSSVVTELNQSNNNNSTGEEEILKHESMVNLDIMDSVTVHTVDDATVTDDEDLTNTFTLNTNRS